MGYPDNWANVHHSEKHSPEWIRSRINTIPNGQNPKWARSQMYTISNGQHLKWAPYRMNTILNGHQFFDNQTTLLNIELQYSTALKISQRQVRTLMKTIFP